MLCNDVDRSLLAYSPAVSFLPEYAPISATTVTFLCGLGGEHGFGGACVIPALGNSWHHCVSTRLVLEHFTTHRTVTVTKSPIAAQHTARCELTAAGLIETDADGKQLGFTVMP